jgi:hypothetical protein
MKRLRQEWLDAIQIITEHQRQVIPGWIGQTACAVARVTDNKHVRVIRLMDGKTSTRPVHYERVSVTNEVAEHLEVAAKLLTANKMKQYEPHFEAYF